MAVFDLQTNLPKNVRKQTEALDEYYYSIDTASIPVINSWLDFNGYTNSYAMLGEELVGYYNLMPIKESTARAFFNGMLKEEDITTEHMLSAQEMRKAQYFYLPAITVKDYKSYRSRQAVAALISGMASHLLSMFDLPNLKAIYANPTTYQGNMLINKMGFQPLYRNKRPLGAGNDIYVLSFEGDALDRLRRIEQRYSRFVGKNPWPELGRTGIN